MKLRLAELFADLPDRPRLVGCTLETEIEGLATDSRQVQPGQAFLALRGHTHDAHRFVPMALQRGARVVLLEEGRIAAPQAAHVWFPDTAKAHPHLAANAYGRPAQGMEMLGVTGTNGKTTTTVLLASILQAAQLPIARLGTTSNFIVDHEVDAAFTTPFPLELQSFLAQARDAGAGLTVMEVSSHALAQGRVESLQFAAVGMTSFSQDHLDFHKTMDAYLSAKLMLAERYLAPSGTAVAALDDQPACARFLEAARQRGARAWGVSRGGHPEAEILASNIEMRIDGIRARVDSPHGAFDLQSALIGTFNLDNLLVATGMALAIDVPIDVVSQALRDARGAPGRLERVTVSGFVGPQVVVDYAHTPDAVERALETVRAICPGRVIVVLGCGGDRDPTKRLLMARAASRGADAFWATSDNPRSEDPEAILDDMLRGLEASNVHREVDRGAAIRGAIASAQQGDLVLIAGKGHETYQIIGDERLDFDDREHARRAMSSCL